MKIKMKREMLNKLHKINRNYKIVNISDIGCYELKYEDIRRVASDNRIMSEMVDVLFKRIDNEIVLSRNAIYYDFNSFHFCIESFVMLLARIADVYDEDKSVMYVLSAMLDYFENYQLTYWYALFEVCIENVEFQDALYEYCEKINCGIQRVIKIHLQVYVGEDIDCKKLIDEINKQCVLIKTSWDFVKNNIELSFRLFREYDNRIKCINEIVYDIYALERDGIIVDNLFMPLYGASLIAVYASPVMEFFNINRNIKVMYARIGFHDLLPLELSADLIKINEPKIAPLNYIEKMKRVFSGKITLVIDDNVGYGSTISCCKKMIETYGGCCYTRTPETSWDRILESDIKLMTDYPGIFNYLRYTQQCEFIEELKKSDTYNRELEYNKSDRYVDISSLGKYKLSDMQKERINREYKERKQFDIINYACDLEDASYLNRVNIDILNGKCTADEKLNISGTIGNLLNECMEICIVDLNKSIYGHSSNELNRYLKQYPKKIWITGGITSVAEAEALIQNGAKGVVIGSTIYREGLSSKVCKFF